MLRATDCLLLLLLSSLCGGDEAKTVMKKVPALQEPPVEFPSKIKLDDAFKRWSLDGFWRSRRTGIHVALNTPDVIAGITARQAKAKFLSDDERQSLWQENLKKDWGEKITFSGWIQMHTSDYSPDDVDVEWNYFLFLENGRRIQSTDVIMGNIERTRGDRLYYNHWQRTFTVRFDNKDPDNGQPILTPESKQIIFGVGGIPGSIKTRFEFDVKKKK
jgi:hypothetical protein